MDREIDLTGRERTLYFTGEKTFSPGVRIEQPGRSLIAARGDNLRRNFQIRPRCLQRLQHHCSLDLRQFAAARTERDFFQTARTHALRFRRQSANVRRRCDAAASAETKRKIGHVIGDDLFRRCHLLPAHREGLRGD